MLLLSANETAVVSEDGDFDSRIHIAKVSKDLILTARTWEVQWYLTALPDLFWAVQGGGSGFGIITSLTRAVIASPKPEKDKERKFSYISVGYSTVGDEARKKFLKNLQNFLYDNPKSSKFGGTEGLQKHSIIYLASSLGVQKI